ncbi:hypothetical protein B0H14DRAFT_2640833 [Mycena olivaceomarginata]|nr:hypothetical protein B0H14DRAFT_2640833 [Mycena olivaceomarginata]
MTEIPYFILACNYNTPSTSQFDFLLWSYPVQIASSLQAASWNAPESRILRVHYIIFESQATRPTDAGSSFSPCSSGRWGGDLGRAATQTRHTRTVLKSFGVVTGGSIRTQPIPQEMLWHTDHK